MSGDLGRRAAPCPKREPPVGCRRTRAPHPEGKAPRGAPGHNRGGWRCLPSAQRGAAGGLRKERGALPPLRVPQSPASHHLSSGRGPAQPAGTAAPGKGCPGRSGTPSRPPDRPSGPLPAARCRREPLANRAGALALALAPAPGPAAPRISPPRCLRSAPRAAPHRPDITARQWWPCPSAPRGPTIGRPGVASRLAPPPQRAAHAAGGGGATRGHAPLAARGRGLADHVPPSPHGAGSA